MKFLQIFFLTLLINLPVIAQPQTAVQNSGRISDAQVKQFTQNCLKGAAKDQTMTPQTKQIYCQCTGAFMQKNLTVTDLQNMPRNDQAGRDALNKTILGVHAPCMEFPVRDLIQKECMANPQLKPKTICGCLSKNMAAYTAKSAQKTLASVLAKTPNAFDPMGEILKSPEFQAEQKRISLACLTGSLK